MTDENKDFSMFDASSADVAASEANTAGQPNSAQPTNAVAGASTLEQTKSVPVSPDATAAQDGFQVQNTAANPASVTATQPVARPQSTGPVNPFEEQQAFGATAQYNVAPTQQQPRVDIPQVDYQPNQQAAAATVPPQMGTVQPKKKHPAVAAGLCGLAGGVVGALAIVLALRSASGINLSQLTATNQSSAGQTVTLSPKNDDVTVSQAVAAKALPSVVSVYVTTDEGEGLGSGVILDNDGNILTNWHVAGDAKEISVTVGGKNYDATLVGGDSSSDLAVIKADFGGDQVTPMEVGDSDKLVVGDWVMTIGSPFGLDQSVSAGIVSSLARNELMQSTYGTTIYANLIQTDACINPGNSGGALVNSEGKLVGISTLFSSDTESFAGIGFAIPGNYAIEIANKIIAGEQVTHAYIGLTMQTVTAQNAAAHNLPVNQGAYVAQVADGSPAAEAGIQPGDIVISMGDQQITSADGMILAVRSHSIGETVTVTVMRGKEQKSFDVTLSSDEALQLQQEQQKQQWLEEPQGQQNQQYQQYQQYQQEQQQNDGYGDMLDEIMRYLYDNNHGGSYEQE